jgi:hypothetical protein
MLFSSLEFYNYCQIDQDITRECSDAASYCGIRDRKYPDKKPMGYPFDRLPRAGVERLSQFLTPNMRVQDVKIVHDSNRTETRGPPSKPSKRQAT